jgi:hypothetical protein
MVRILIALLLCAGAAQARDAAHMRERHAALQSHFVDSPFGRALHVESDTSDSRHKGEVYAVIDRPYAVVAAGLARATSWCAILTLQVNIKHCEAIPGGLAAHVTRRARDSVEDAHRIDFRFEAAARREDYLRVALRADEGPVGTRDYEIVLQAAPLDARRSFLHLSYAYKLGWMARLAMDAYLAGPGRDKKGFTVDGGPRGVVERNAMRYYLAVDAFLGARALETRLRRWYAETMRYPQLREEISLEQYVEMKRSQGPG